MRIKGIVCNSVYVSVVMMNYRGIIWDIFVSR